MTSVEFRDVSFGYDKKHKVLDHIDLRIEGKGLYCIIGPNGVGKSTLMKCINRLLRPTEGTVLLNGTDVTAMSPRDIALEVGFVPAASVDLFSMPVVDTVLIGRHNHHRWRTTDEDLDMVYRTLKLLEIDDLAMRRFNQLSAGQHQKVSLARGLVQDTPILLLDEPTSNLDVKHQTYVAEMLRALAEAEDKIVIMISHDLNIAARYANEIIILAEPGRLYSVGPPNEVIDRKTVTEVYGVECEVIDYKGTPHVILGSAL